MITKIRKIAYSIAAAIIVAPVLVSAQTGSGFAPPSNTGLPTGSLTKIVSGFMTWILGIVGFLGVIGFAIAGILYLTAAGDEDRIATAKRAMTWSIVGVIVALLGVVIIQAAQGLLGEKTDF